MVRRSPGRGASIDARSAQTIEGIDELTPEFRASRRIRAPDDVVRTMYGGLCSSAWPISAHPGTWQESAHVGQLAATSAVAARDPLAHHHPVRSPRPRRAAGPASRLLSVLGALAGCPSEGSLTLPDLDTAQSWVVVLSGGSMDVPYAQVLGADEALRLGTPHDPGVRLEILAFDDALAEPSGPLDPRNVGARLPEALASYAAVLDDGPPRWQEQSPSAAASQVRLPHAEPTCPRLDGTSETVTDNDLEGIVGLIGLGGDRVAVFTAPVWWLLDEFGAHPVPTQVRGVRAAAIDFLSAVWLATPSDIWTIYGEDPKVVTASLAWSLPPGLLTVALAAPKPARLFLLSRDGALYLSTREGTRELYRFEGAEPGTLAQLVVDGQAQHRSPVPARPVEGQNQERQGVAAAREADGEGRGTVRVQPPVEGGRDLC
jgi:hypothetical protein